MFGCGVALVAVVISSFIPAVRAAAAGEKGEATASPEVAAVKN